MEILTYACQRAGMLCFPSVHLLLSSLLTVTVPRCVTKHPKLSGIGNSHFLMIRESVGWEFRESTGRMARLCTLMSEISTGKVQMAGGD